MELTDLVQGQLTDAERLTLGALITLDVHARDAIQELVDAGETVCCVNILPQLGACFLVSCSVSRSSALWWLACFTVLACEMWLFAW